MAAPYGAPPRNLSRFKLTHAEPAGGPPGPGRAAGSSRRGMAEIISPYIRILSLSVSPALFLSRSLRLSSAENDRPALFPLFVNDRAVKRRVTGATVALTNRRRDPRRSIHARRFGITETRPVLDSARSTRFSFVISCIAELKGFTTS